MALYTSKVINDFTGEVKILSANDKYTLDFKTKALIETWEKKNQRIFESQNKEKSIFLAAKQTEDAIRNINDINNLLLQTLKVNDKVDWDELRMSKKIIEAPLLNDFMKNVPKQSFFEVFEFQKNNRLKAEQHAKKMFELSLQKWKELESEKNDYIEGINKLKDSYEKLDVKSIEKYNQLVLERSKYPTGIDLLSEITYDINSRLLFVELELPSMNDIPSTVEYKYNTSRKETVEKKMDKKVFEKYYDDTLIKITLRTIHEVIEADYINAFDTVVLNGFVNGKDTKTGKDFRNCVISVQSSKEEFLGIDLAYITPRECFRYLKGLTAGSLVNLSPIRPVMILNKEDKRIIAADKIIDSYDENKNLASMDWQEFEVLVRDIIQREFSSETCNVEVTQASRDGGVDAIAFDEDPIRGGKYVIQAKRYNNLVPVSAVRDLYGTVLNEGAVKGILVTTSYFGKDSLEFARNKPLTLINGEGLLSMLSKHGFNFKIEILKKRKFETHSTY